MKNRMETLVHAAAAWIRTSRLGFLVGVEEREET